MYENIAQKDMNKFDVKKINYLSCSSPRLAKKALLLIFKLVSGVTISVLLKSIDPSPGWGLGYPTPIPAGQADGVEGAKLEATAGVRG